MTHTSHTRHTHVTHTLHTHDIHVTHTLHLSCVSSHTRHAYLVCRESAAELCCHLALDSKLKCHARTCHTYTPHITYTTHKLHTRYTRSGHRSSWLCLAASSRLNAHLCVTHTHTHTSHMHPTHSPHTAHTRIAHTTRTASLGNTSLPLRPPIHAYMPRTHTHTHTQTHVDTHTRTMTHMHA